MSKDNFIKNLFRKIKSLFVHENVEEKSIEVKVVQEFEKNMFFKMPITKNEVVSFLSMIDQKYLKGISEIRLKQRPIYINCSVLASYIPQNNGTSIIELYPIECTLEGDYFISKDNQGYVKELLTINMAKDIALFNLGHEIGHNEIFLKSGKLTDFDIEKQCDNFSKNLNLINVFNLPNLIYQN